VTDFSVKITSALLVVLSVKNVKNALTTGHVKNVMMAALLMVKFALLAQQTASPVPQLKPVIHAPQDLSQMAMAA
jgi:ABC-type transport system involved in cytochrome bd biosynthesis fused ATPase/permease subunit